MKYKHIANHAKLIKKLKEIKKSVYEIEDPMIITEYKTLFSKTIGIFSRGNITAYLIKEYLDCEYNRANRSSNEKNNYRDVQQTGAKQSRERYMRYLINITKNHASEAEITSFLLSHTTISSHDLLRISVSDKNTLVHIKHGTHEQFVSDLTNTKFKSIALIITPFAFKNNKNKMRGSRKRS